MGAAVQEGSEVVQDDLRQAKDVTLVLEEELAGKSKEVLHLKFLLERTKAHFGHLQDSVAALRTERHKLANDAMRAMGLDKMLARMTEDRDRLKKELGAAIAALTDVATERDRLKKEVQGVLEGLAVENVQKQQQELRFDKRDQRIAELTIELTGLRQEMAELRRINAPPAPVPKPPPLKTSAETGENDDFRGHSIEIVATDRVAGKRV